jgi:hypothetical protein
VETVDSNSGQVKDVVFSTDEPGGKVTRIRYSFKASRYRPISCEKSEWQKKVYCDSNWQSDYPTAATFPASL